MVFFIAAQKTYTKFIIVNMNLRCDEEAEGEVLIATSAKTFFFF